MRTGFIQIRVTEEEKEKIKQQADKYNLSISNYVRMITCSELVKNTIYKEER